MSTRSLALPFVLTLVSALVFQHEAQGQSPAPASGPWIELRTRYLGASDGLGRTPLVTSSFALTVHDVEAVPSFGLGVGMHLTEHVGLRLTVDRSLYAAANGYMQCTPYTLCTQGLQSHPLHVRRWEVGLDTQYRSEADWLPFRTVVSAGVGALRTQTAMLDSYGGYSGYSDARRTIDVSLLFRASVGGERRVGGVDLFLETAASAGTVGEPAQQFIEGAFPDSRRTDVLISLSGGVRYGLR